MSDINEAMGISPASEPPPEHPAERKKPKPKRVRPSRAKPKPAAASTSESPPRPARPAEPAVTETQPARIRAGQRCPKCERGLIGVLRTRLYRAKNKRVVILRCRNTQCWWDLDGDGERVNPINPAREVLD